MTIAPGTILNDRYIVNEFIGEGGFGRVYRAFDKNLECSVAIKENIFAPWSDIDQYSREAKILARLRHPNLVVVHDQFTSPEGAFLVMDYIEGLDLEDLVIRRNAPLPVDEAVAWIKQILEAVEYLHKEHVIHRDIKPANIKINRAGQAILYDFGIATKDEANSKSATYTHSGTPGYSPIEQYSALPIDRRSDIYSLGATLLYILTNSKPIDSPSCAAGIRQHSAREFNPAVPVNLDKVIKKAIALQPDHRYQSVADFKQALGKYKTPAIFTVLSSITTIRTQAKHRSTPKVKKSSTIKQIDSVGVIQLANPDPNVRPVGIAALESHQVITAWNNGEISLHAQGQSQALKVVKLPKTTSAVKILDLAPAPDVHEHLTGCYILARSRKRTSLTAASVCLYQCNESLELDRKYAFCLPDNNFIAIYQNHLYSLGVTENDPCFSVFHNFNPEPDPIWRPGFNFVPRDLIANRDGIFICGLMDEIYTIWRYQTGRSQPSIIYNGTLDNHLVVDVPGDLRQRFYIFSVDEFAPHVKILHYGRNETTYRTFQDQNNIPPLELIPAVRNPIAANKDIIMVLDSLNRQVKWYGINWIRNHTQTR